MTAAASRAGNPAQSPGKVSITRMTGLRIAASLVGGQDRLAEIIGIAPRSLRAKLSADRGINEAECLVAADALDARALQLTQLAVRLRAEAGVRPSDPTSQGEKA